MLISSFIHTINRSKLTCSRLKLKNACELDCVCTNVTRNFYLTTYHLESKKDEKSDENNGKPPPLDKEKAKALIMKLSEEERNIISNALKEFEALKRKQEYAGL